MTDEPIHKPSRITHRTEAPWYEFENVTGIRKFLIHLAMLFIVMVVWTAGVYAVASVIEWISPPSSQSSPRDDVCDPAPLEPEFCNN